MAGLEIMTTKLTSNFWSDRRVFLTGCTGLLGSWLTEALVGAGADVVGLVRDRVPKSRLVQTGLINQISVVSGEVEDYLLLERSLNEYQVQTVFHLAAQTIVGIANQSPLSTFDTNIRGTWNLLEASRRTSWVESVVVASSDKAYGEHEKLPYTEDAELKGRHPYDVSKSCADLISQGFSVTYGLPVSIARCGNLFGAGDLNFNRLIPGTIRSVLRGEAPVIRSDGKPTRDYVYVEDAANAYMLLAEATAKQTPIQGNAFNFSYERPMPATEVVDAIIRQMGKADLKAKILNNASNEIPHQFLESGKARTMLGWKPGCDFEEGLKRTIPWYENVFKEQLLND